MYYVYVVWSVLRKIYYKGITKDIERRLKEHYKGKVGTTRSLLPLQLVHVEVCSTMKQARAIEKYLKSGFGREVIKEIHAAVVELEDTQS